MEYIEQLVWFLVMLGFLGVEGATVGLVSIWFAVGSLVGLIAAACGASVLVQIILAVVVSGLCLALVRPLAKKFLVPKITKTNVDALTGKAAIVTEHIHNLQETGAVKVNGLTWTARSTNGSPIEKGATVTIDKVEGVKLYVSLR